MRRADPTLAPAPSQARPPTTRFQLPVPSAAPQSPVSGQVPAPVLAPVAALPSQPVATSGPVTTSTLGAVVVTRHGTNKPMTLSIPVGSGSSGPSRATPLADARSGGQGPVPNPPPRNLASGQSGPASGSGAANLRPRAADGAPTTASSGVVTGPYSRGVDLGTGPVSLPPPPSFPAEMHTPTAVRDVTGSVPQIARPKGETIKTPAAKKVADKQEPTATGIVGVLPETRHAKVMPMPRVPNAGNPIALAWYVIQVGRAIHQRRGAIKWMQKDIVSQQESLDGVLGMLGRAACEAKLDLPAFAEEMRAINAADARRLDAEKAISELGSKKSSEDGRFAEQIAVLKDALANKAATLSAADRELRAKQNERQKLRDEASEHESKVKAYLRSSEEKESTAGRSEDAAMRAAIRREAESLRNEARRLEGPRDALNRRLGELSRPLADAERTFEAAQREHDTTKKAVTEAQNAHNQVDGEIGAQHALHATEKTNAEREIARHHVTLGTMVNLHRVDRPELKPIYERIDTIRRSINSLEAEIDHLKAEKYARDRATMQKGILVLAGAFVALIGIIVLLSIALS